MAVEVAWESAGNGTLVRNLDREPRPTRHGMGGARVPKTALTYATWRLLCGPGSRYNWRHR